MTSDIYLSFIIVINFVSLLSHLVFAVSCSRSFCVFKYINVRVFVHVFNWELAVVWCVHGVNY